MENSMGGPQKIKKSITLWPRNSTSWYLSEETQTTNLKRYVHPYVPCGIIYKSQAMEATEVPINRGMGKEVVHIHNGILFSHRKEEHFAI